MQITTEGKTFTDIESFIEYKKQEAKERSKRDYILFLFLVSLPSESKTYN